MKAVFLYASPYADDAMNLPVADVAAAIPYYESRLGFRVLERHEEAPKSVILARDNIKIGLAENGGDPEQEGCFFEVNDVVAAFEEIKGKSPTAKDIKTQESFGNNYRVFFEIAPDGLCYMLGQRV
ncbi:MAG TPA: VOC family protein [Pyrinomonadaceae bacterium]|nr:VOC family protein [Pyrinomonadaceae bacterium]